MITINLSPSQYRVVHLHSPSSVECSRECSSTARASRMSQFQATLANTKTKPALLPTTHPIYGVVNLALLAVSIYLLWANFL